MTKPTDVELMMYFDGELDEPRRKEVEAFIAKEANARRKVMGLGLAGSIVRESATSSSVADAIADGVMAAIQADATTKEGSKRISGLPKPAKAANDNSKSIFALAAVAVAAAAAVMIWGRTNDAPIVNDKPIAAVTSTVAPTEAPQPSAAPQPQNDEADEERGVEVAAVDFGANTGTIISTNTMTVLWVQDDSSGD